PQDVRRDPVHGCPEPRKPPMNDDEVAISHDHPGLVSQRRRHALDQVEEALATGSDVRAVLDVGGRPVALRRDVVSLVEQGIEGLKYECLILLVVRLTHGFAAPYTVVALLCGEAAVDQQTVAGHERRLAGRKPDGRVSDLFRLANATDGVHGGHLRTELRLLAGKALKHVGVDYRRQNGVDADALFAELPGRR